jgi:hypothetical protein
MNTRKKWQYFVADYVKNNHINTKDIDMAREISEITGKWCTLESVRKIRQRLGLKKKEGRPAKNKPLVLTEESCHFENNNKGN